jgi:hypothetical protein
LFPRDLLQHHVIRTRLGATDASVAHAEARRSALPPKATMKSLNDFKERTDRAAPIDLSRRYHEASSWSAYLDVMTPRVADPSPTRGRPPAAWCH